MKWLIAISVLFSSLALSLPERESNSFVEKELARAFRADLSGEVEIKIERFSSLEAIPQTAKLISWSPHPPIGLVHQEWQWEHNGQLHKTYGTAAVKVFAKIAIAKAPIKNGESLNSSNVFFESRELGPYIAAGYFLDPSQVFNRIAYGFVRSGAVLSGANTQAAFLVTRGQIVDLSSQQGPLQVTAQVEALKEGRLGDWIPVENTRSRKIIQARVVGSGILNTH